jgi:hypothetical protein
LTVVQLVVGVARPPDFDPMLVGESLPVASSVGAMGRILLTVVAAVTLVVGPGLFLRDRLGQRFLLGPAFVWIPGGALLAATGLLAWLLAWRVDPQVTSVAVLAPVSLVLLWTAVRGSGPSLFVPGELAVCGVLVLLVLIGTAKATWSSGPAGELYGGLVGRSLEPSDRSDSAIPYRIVQLVAHGLAPESRVGSHYFAPYSFSDRGPIAGVAAAPIVLSSGADPSIGHPFPWWAPFDRQGFAAYRITLEVFAAGIALSVFGLLSSLFERRVAWAGTLLVASTPFVIHEVYFTWPKLLAGSFGIAALTALLARRRAVAGGLLGCSYLSHPVGLFIALAVVGTWFGREWHQRSPQRSWNEWRAWAAGHARSLAPAAAGLAVSVLAWRVVNIGSLHQSERFGGYVLMANNELPASHGQWLTSRARSIGNTVVPGELLIWDRHAANINLFTSGKGLVGFLWWNTLPFGVGLLYFPVFLAGLARFGRRNPAILLAGLMLPLAAFTIYWGATVTGMMREGLQGWLVFALLMAFLGHSVVARSRRWSRTVQLCLAARGIEILAMLTGATLLTDELLRDNPYRTTDIASLALMLSAVTLLTTLTWRAFAPPARDGQRREAKYFL